MRILTLTLTGSLLVVLPLVLGCGGPDGDAEDGPPGRYLTTEHAANTPESAYEDPAGGSIRAAWDRACELDSPSAYREFIQEFPDSPFTDEAYVRLETYDAWWEARNAGTLDALRAFQREHPEAAFRAEGMIAQLELDAAWDAARTAHTIPAYQEFLNAYPIGRYRREAEDRLETLQEQYDWAEALVGRAQEALDQGSWLQAKLFCESVLNQGFPERWPSIHFALQTLQDVNAHFDDRATERRETARLARQARSYESADNPDAAMATWRELIQAWPFSPHASEAREALRYLEQVTRRRNQTIQPHSNRRWPDLTFPDAVATIVYASDLERRDALQAWQRTRLCPMLPPSVPDEGQRLGGQLLHSVNQYLAHLQTLARIVSSRDPELARVRLDPRFDDEQVILRIQWRHRELGPQWPYYERTALVLMYKAQVYADIAALARYLPGVSPNRRQAWVDEGLALCERSNHPRRSSLVGRLETIALGD